MERRKVSCEVQKLVADEIKKWATARNIECFRSECYDNIYVQMTLSETEIAEVDALIDDCYERLLECRCATCGKVNHYLLTESETKLYSNYQLMGRQMGLLQDIFPNIPAWIRSGAIDKYSNGFCICPECCGIEA